MLLSGDNQFPAIWSDEGKYLASVLGDALVKGLTRVSEQRPEDPVEYLANFLRTYKGEDGEESVFPHTATSRPLSPSQQEYEDAIAAAADAAIITSVPLHTSSSSPTTHLLENVQEQTEESGETGDENSTSTSPVPAAEEDEQNAEQEEQPMEQDIQPDQEQNELQADDDQVEEPEETQEEEQESQDLNEDSKPEQDEEMSPDEQEPTPEEAEEATQDSPPPEAPDTIFSDQQEQEEQDEPAAAAESDESHIDAVAQLTNNEHSLLMNGVTSPENDNDADDLIRRLDDEVAEQQTNSEDEILPVQTDLEEEIEGAGQRDDRGQSVLHFAAARPGGSQTLLAFLQNPLVNLAWRDENLKTARDVASSLGRTENVQTIDSYVVSKAVAGDYEAIEKLMLDGYDNLNDVEDSTKANINTLAEKAGHDKVLQLLESVPQFRDNVEKLMDSIRLGDLERVKDLVAADPRLAIAMGKLGRTPLHVAVLCEEYPTVQFLAHEFPATLRRGDNLERTALHYAMGIEKVEKMTRILVRMGAKRVVKDIKGRQPSYYFINREEIATLQEEERS